MDQARRNLYVLWVGNFLAACSFSLVMPFLLYLFLREKINRRETWATVLTFVGVGVLGFSDYTISTTFLKGDLVCFISMLFFSIYLVLGVTRPNYLLRISSIFCMYYEFRRGSRLHKTISRQRS